jgi:hypothetical protein
MKTKYLFLIAIIIQMTAQVHAQEWEEAMRKPGANFYKIQKTQVEKFKKASLDAETRTGNNEENKDSKDYELTKFRRWEWYWSSRVNEDGSFPSRDQILEGFKEHSEAAETRVVNASDANWVNISRTANTGGYNGMGQTCDIAYHPTDNNIFWVTARSGGIWKTTNGGTSYTPQGDKLPYLGSGAVLADKFNGNNVYLSLGNHRDSYSLGIYKSTDGGANWNPTGFTKNLSDLVIIYALKQSITTANTIYAATSLGLIRTTDGGTNWTTLKTGNCSDVELHVTDANIIYAAIGTEILKSADGGTTFTQILNTAPTAKNKIAVTKASATTILAWNENKVWMSTNSGTNWTQKTSPEAKSESMLISPNNANILYSGNLNIFKSTNGGTSWTMIGVWSKGQSGAAPTVPEVHADHRNLSYNPYTNNIFSLNDGGVDRYNESTSTWTRLSNGLVIPEYYSAASSSSNAAIIGAGSQDNGGAGRDANNVWFNTNGGDAGTQAIDPSNDAIRYSNYNPRPMIIKTTNAWTSNFELPLPTGVLNEPGYSWWQIPYVLQENKPSTIYVGYHAVYRSDNGGNNWVKISPDFATPKDYWKLLRHVAVSSLNPNYIYAALPTEMKYTSNGGQSWSGSFVDNQEITGIAVSPLNPRIVYATCGGYNTGKKAYKSIDGGATWTNISSGLPNVPIHDIVYQNGANEILYVGTEFGVYYRKAGMTSWAKYGNNIPSVPVIDLHIQYSSGKLRAATFGRGMYEAEILNTTCYGPVNPFTDDVTTTSAKISWGSVSFATNYTVFYKKVGTTTWTNLTTATNTVTLTGLTANTAYDVDIVSNCQDGSRVNTALIFRTAVAGCVAPPNVVTSSISANAAFASWTPVANATKYYIWLKPGSGAFYLALDNIETPKTFLNGLLANTTYTMDVYAECSTGSFSTRTTFTTNNTVVPSGEIKSENKDGKKGFSIYPTVVSRNSNIDLDLTEFNESQHQLTLRVTTANGTQVMQNAIASGKHTMTTEKLNANNQGIYFIQIIEGDKIFTKEIIIVE